MRLLRILIALLALGGLAVSVLALRVHLQDPGAAPPCAVSEHWDCGAVNHSRFAVFPPRSFDEDVNSKGHLPVAIAGVAGYVLIVVLALCKIDFVVMLVAQAGFFCALMLTFLEKYVLEKWCIYCVLSQGILAVLMLLAVTNYLLARRTQSRAGLHLRTI